MSLNDVLDHLERAAVIVEASEHGRLRLRALFDDRPLTADTRDLCRASKQELLDYVQFTREADRLLLESTRRLADAWPEGCILQSDERWNEAEAVLHHAYWTLDEDQLIDAIAAREIVALDIFATFNHERTR